MENQRDRISITEDAVLFSDNEEEPKVGCDGRDRASHVTLYRDPVFGSGLLFPLNPCHWATAPIRSLSTYLPDGDKSGYHVTHLKQRITNVEKRKSSNDADT